MGSNGLPGPTRKTEEASQTISEIAEELKKAASQLHFVVCTTQPIETVADTTRLDAATRFGTREITLCQLSFTHCDIWIAMPGGEVALEGGMPNVTLRAAAPAESSPSRGLLSTISAHCSRRPEPT
jgi:hypothetical protein